MTTQIHLGPAPAEDFDKLKEFESVVHDLQSHLSEVALCRIAEMHFRSGVRPEVTAQRDIHRVSHLGEARDTFVAGRSTVQLHVDTAGGRASFLVGDTARTIEARLAQAQEEAREARLSQRLLHSAVVSWLFPKGVPTQCEHTKPPRMSAKRKALVDALYPDGLPYDCPHHDDCDDY